MSKKNKQKLSQSQLDRNKKISSLKTMYFNRFLMVRYILAVMVFASFFLAFLSWQPFTGYAAAALLVFAALPMWELGNMYGKAEPSVKWTRRYYMVQLVFNCGLCLVCWMAP